MNRFLKYVVLIVFAEIPIGILSVLIPINPQNSIAVGNSCLYLDTFKILWIPVILILVWFVITDIRELRKNDKKKQ